MVCDVHVSLYQNQKGFIEMLIIAATALGNETIADFATSHPMHLSTFSEVFQKMGLESVLNASGPIQIFAPTNEAFNTLLNDDLGIGLEELLGRNALTQKILAYHVVMDASQGSGVRETLLPGYAVVVENSTVIDGMGSVGNITATVHASNGYMFVIDKVLLPATNELV